MNEWISVKDRLPEEGTRVLTIDFGKFQFHSYNLDYIVRFESEPEGYIWACRLENDFEKVTHWMPLPQPPEKQHE